MGARLDKRPMHCYRGTIDPSSSPIVSSNTQPSTYPPTAFPATSSTLPPPLAYWREQCKAARQIREAFGPSRALSYLVGDKFMGALQALERDRSLLPEVESFAAEVRSMLRPDELRTYLLKGRARAGLGLPTDDLRYRPDQGALVAQMKQMLL